MLNWVRGGRVGVSAAVLGFICAAGAGGQVPAQSSPAQSSPEKSSPAGSAQAGGVTPPVTPVKPAAQPPAGQPTAGQPPAAQLPAGQPPAAQLPAAQSPAALPDAPSAPKKPAECKVHCPPPFINWYMRFLNGPQVKPMTPPEKAWLAAKNVIDPFNQVTSLGNAAISIGANAHSPYGPGMSGFGKYVGVSYTQDITGEFFNTFLIPSIMHQDPHYHRMPHATIKRRIGHAMLQVLWTQGDDGKGMLNYSNIAGDAIDDEISNLYVPGRQTNLPSSAERYGINLATSPIDNFVTEFLPDVASHIHVQVVLIQRIINTVAKTDTANGQ